VRNHPATRIKTPQLDRMAAFSRTWRGADNAEEKRATAGAHCMGARIRTASP